MKSKRLFIRVFFLPVLIMLVITGCRNQQTDSQTEVAVPVTIKDLRPGSIEEFIETNGTAMPTREVELKSEMAGKYFLQNNPRTGQPWKLGDRIIENELIARFEDAEYVNNVQIETRRLNLEISKNEFEKLKSMFDIGGATQRELTNAEQAYITADYNFKNAELQLAKLRVIAPYDGVIVDLPYYTRGNKITAGSIIAKIMDYQKLFMEFQLPEKNLALINVNQKVRILNYALPDDTLSGIISQLSPAIDPGTRNFKGVLTIVNNQLKLRPGSYIKAEIITRFKDSTIVIPKDIILSRQRGKTVYVIDQNTAMERTIVTGLENPKYVEVIRGLSFNERVVIEGFETLGNRSKVKIIQ